MTSDRDRRTEILRSEFGEQPWYAVRCVFRTGENHPWGPTDLTSEAAAYEERVTLWRASSSAEAIERAEAEARDYASDPDGTEYVGLAQAYHLFADPGDGAEVFSLIRKSELAPNEYVDRFFDTGAEYQQSAE